MSFSSLIQIKTYGVSMAPFFKDGDVLEIKKIPFSKIKVNDFITFKKSGTFNFRASENQGSAKQVLITHRVIFKSKQFLITKGDQNLKSDGKIYPRQILGKVINTPEFYLIQSSLYFNELVKITNVLNKDDIDFVFLKGLPIHLYFEKTHPQRLYADCDLLIKNKDLPKLAKILKKLGFTPSPKSLSINNKNHSELSYQKYLNNFPIILDIHLQAVFLMTQINNLDPLYPQKLLNQFTQDLLENKQIVKIDSHFFPILSTQNLILYLALHLFHHNFRGYFRYEFLNNIISNEKINFNDLAKKITKYKLKNFVYPVFLLLKKHYSTPLPHQFLKSIQPDKRILKLIKRKILKVNIFEDELRIKSGVERFKNLFDLSPNPLLKKFLLIFNPQVLYSFYWVLRRRWGCFIF